MTKYLGLADLSDRWNYTKSGIHKLIKNDNFPKPFAIINRGKVKIFHEDSISEYEKDKPWLFDVDQKINRQKLFCLLQTVKELPLHEQKTLLVSLFGKD
jgi:predicted DNA-binding transcriptional regulator AlpA